MMYELGVELGESWLACVVEDEDGVDHGIKSLETGSEQSFLKS